MKPALIVKRDATANGRELLIVKRIPEIKGATAYPRA